MRHTILILSLILCISMVADAKPPRKGMRPPVVPPSHPSDRRHQPRPNQQPNYQQGAPQPPHGYQQGPPQGYQQQGPPQGYQQYQQQGPPQGYQQQGPPQGYQQQGPPQGYQQPPPGYQQQGPPQGYQQQGPPSGYQQQGPPQGYQQQGPPQGYQQQGPPQGYQQQGPPQGYQQQGPPQGYQQQQGPPQGYQQQPPPGYQQQGPPQGHQGQRQGARQDPPAAQIFGGPPDSSRGGVVVDDEAPVNQGGWVSAYQQSGIYDPATAADGQLPPTPPPEEYFSGRMEPLGTHIPPSWLNFTRDNDLIPTGFFGHAELKKAIYLIDSNQDRMEGERIMAGILEQFPDMCVVPALFQRGRVLSSRGMLNEGLADLDKALECAGSEVLSLSFLYVRGLLLSKLGRPGPEIQKLVQSLSRSTAVLRLRSMMLYSVGMFGAALPDLTELSRRESNDAETWMFRGKCEYWVGQFDKAIECWRKVVKLEPWHAEAWSEIAVTDFMHGRRVAAEEAWNHTIEIDHRHIFAIQNTGQMAQRSGDYPFAAKYLHRCLELNDNEQFCHHLLGCSYHGLGKFRKAEHHYVRAMELTPSEVDWYELQYMHYNQIHLDDSVDSYCADKELDERMRNDWSGRFPPSEAENRGHKYIKLFNEIDHTIPDVGNEKGKLKRECNTIVRLVEDLWPTVIDYTKFFHLSRTPGFLNNPRQRWCLAMPAMEMAQLLIRAWDKGETVAFTNVGASQVYQTSKLHTLGWRDMADIFVRWRRFGEVTDAVLWGDVLDEYSADASSSVASTPLIDGEFKLVRYYPYFDRAFEKMKEDTARRATIKGAPMHTIAELKNKIRHAKTLDDFFLLMDKRPTYGYQMNIKSIAKPGRVLGGTSLTYSKQHVGFWFHIKTPRTENRLKDYDEEMAYIFAKIARSFKALEANPQDTRLQKEYWEHVMTFGFYWFNYMPLVRGTAGVGYGMIQGLFFAAGFGVATPLPSRTQLDFEALLASHPNDYLDKLRDAVKMTPLKTEHSPTSFSSIHDTITTARHMITALNTGAELAEEVWGHD